MRTLAAILIPVLLILPASASAQKKPAEPPEKGHFALTAYAGGMTYDSSQDLGTGPMAGLKFGYDLPGRTPVDSLGIEGVIGWLSAPGSGEGADGSGYLARVDLIYPLILKKKWTPFLSIGCGYANLDREGETDDGLLFGYGGGLKYALMEDLLARFDLRHLFWFEAERVDNVEYTVGLTYVFGVEKKPKPLPPADTDKDGVPDSRDDCPDTPPGMAVDRKGCPTDRTDSDGDGVFDWKDKCPGTAAGIKVDPVGCPLDEDADGVPDHLDRCPGTPTGVPVDASGCVGGEDGAASRP